jgi:hypothetical protein
MVDVINQYVRFPLPRHWGGGPHRHCRWHARQATRKQSDRLSPHPLRRLWRHRLPPHSRYLHHSVPSFISCGVREAVHIPAAPVRDGLVTTFYAYSQPTPAMVPESHCRRCASYRRSKTSRRCLLLLAEGPRRVDRTARQATRQSGAAAWAGVSQQARHHPD